MYMPTLYKSLTALLALSASACSAIIPDVPPDFALPVREILLHTACELQQALASLDTPEFRRFKARQWLITVALTPKTDTNLNLSAGWTRKDPFNNPIRFTTWAISGPGLQFDTKGQRTSGVNFVFKSGELIDDRQLPCELATPSLHALAQHLGVGSWLHRTASAMNVAPSASVDKPSYNTDITIKFAGNGSYTFTFPRGTDLSSFGGSYTLDEQLNIAMAPLAPTPRRIAVVTLPHGDNFGTPEAASLAVRSTIAVETARQRLDVLQLEQAIRSLQPLQ
jgi:hypothetical protein